MGEIDTDSLGSDTPAPPLVLIDADGNDFDPSVASSYKYRDFSHVNEDDEEVLGDNQSPPPARNSMETSIRVQKFPVKLYAILAQKEFHDIIAWMPHGRSWKVLKPNIFESMVMPLFFEYSNYHSFNRLVNAWSFRRVSGGPDRGSYYHELFLRGKPHLQKYMRRLPKTHKKLPMQKKDEPDFYRLDQTNPLPSVENAPIPGGLLALSAINSVADVNNNILVSKRMGVASADNSATMSPADSQLGPMSGGGCGTAVGLMAPPVPIAQPRPQRHTVPTHSSSMYGQPGRNSLDSSIGLPGSFFQDEFGDLNPQEQVFSSFQLPSQGGMAFQDAGTASQVTRGMLHSSSGAFRSTAPSLQLPPQRFRPSNISLLDTNSLPASCGAGGLSFMGMENMANRRSINGHQMNQNVGNPMFDGTQIPGKVSASMPGTFDRLGGGTMMVMGNNNRGSMMMGGGQTMSMIRGMGSAGMGGGSGMPSSSMGNSCNNYGDFQAQRRQLPVNMYQRDAAAFGADNIGNLSTIGNNGMLFPEDFGGPSGGGMNMVPRPMSSGTGMAQTYGINHQ